MDTTVLIMFADLGGALLAGSLIGLEREMRAQPAGLRTHGLVAFGAALAMLIPPFVPVWMVGFPMEALRVDPIKITEGVLAGVGFIGAGVIFREEFSVRGLTTAASIWVTAAIGMLFGIGHHVPAIGATVMVLLVLSALGWLEALIPARQKALHSVRFPADSAPGAEAYVARLSAAGVKAGEVSFAFDRAGGHVDYTMRLTTRRRDGFEALARLVEAEIAPLSFTISTTD